MFGSSVSRAFLRRVGVVAAAAISAAAWAADWGAWQAVPDRFGSGIDVRYRQSLVRDSDGQYEIEYQFRSRYRRKVTARIEFEGLALLGGPRKAALTVTLEPGEQKDLGNQRAPLQKINRAYIVDLRFAGDAPPELDSDEVRRLRELRDKSRQDLERLEEERHRAELLVARVRIAAAVPVQGSPDPNTPLITQKDVLVAEARLRGANQRADAARHALQGLEDQLRAAEGESAKLLEAAGRLAAENKWAEAEIAYEKLARQSPQSGLYRANLAVTLRNQNKLAEAEAAFREAVRLAPGIADYHNGLGGILVARGQGAEAEAPFREAVRLSPGTAAYHADFGLSLLGQKKNAEAQAAFAEAARLTPEDAAYRTYLGAALSRQSKWAEAEAVLREAVRLSPGNPGVHANLAVALARQNKREQAEAEYREALRLDPGNKSYEKSLQALRDRQGQKPQ